MKRYWIATGTVLLIFLGIFALAETAGPTFLANPYESAGPGRVTAGLVGVALLVADIALPVPSSLIMISNGALFGVAVGTGLSMLGNVGAAIAGFYIGRRGEHVLARFVPEDDRFRANRLLEEWGLLAIVVTRPIPLLAETTIIMAGASTMRWRSLMLATMGGSLPVALLYAWTGATTAAFDTASFAIGLALLVAILFWIARNRVRGALASRLDVQ